MYYVYILKCKDNRSYTGCTNNLRQRINRHQKGLVVSTKNRTPVKLSSFFTFHDKHIAFSFEQYLKSSSGRSFIKKHKLFT